MVARSAHKQQISNKIIIQEKRHYVWGHIQMYRISLSSPDHHEHADTVRDARGPIDKLIALEDAIRATRSFGEANNYRAVD